MEAMEDTTAVMGAWVTLIIKYLKKNDSSLWSCLVLHSENLAFTRYSQRNTTTRRQHACE